MSFITTTIQRIHELRNKSYHFFKNDLWYRELPPLATGRGVLLRMARFLHLMVRGFQEDQLRLHATSLTFSTLMSLLPILAIALAIAKALGQDGPAVEKLNEYTRDMPEQFQTLLESILEVVKQTDFGKLGAIGALVLLFMVVQVLTRMEHSFNHVWGIEKPRSLVRRITNYISIGMVVPLFLLAAITVTANIKWGSTAFEQLGLLRLAPFLAIWLAFAFLYGAMPNTPVRFWTAMVSGLIGAMLWQGWFRFYIIIQPGVTRYNLLYGALASVPIFLAWLYVSWLIVLLGAKIAFAVQNGNSYQPELSLRQANLRTKITLAAAVLVRAAKTLREDAPILDKELFAREHALNPFLLDEVLHVLIRHRLLAETTEDPGRYLLLKTPDRLHYHGLVSLFLQDGDDLKDLGIRRVAPLLENVFSVALAGMEAEQRTILDLLSEIEERGWVVEGVKTEPSNQE